MMIVLAQHLRPRLRFAVIPEVRCFEQVVLRTSAFPYQALVARTACSLAEVRNTEEAHRRRCIVAGVPHRGRLVVVGRAGRWGSMVVVGHRM